MHRRLVSYARDHVIQWRPTISTAFIHTPYDGIALRSLHTISKYHRPTKRYDCNRCMRKFSTSHRKNDAVMQGPDSFSPWTLFVEMIIMGYGLIYLENSSRKINLNDPIFIKYLQVIGLTLATSGNIELANAFEEKHWRLCGPDRHILKDDNCMIKPNWKEEFDKMEADLRNYACTEEYEIANGNESIFGNVRIKIWIYDKKPKRVRMKVTVKVYKHHSYKVTNITVFDRIFEQKDIYNDFDDLFDRYKRKSIRKLEKNIEHLFVDRL